jgi:hypothetical protein
VTPAQRTGEHCRQPRRALDSVRQRVQPAIELLEGQIAKVEPEHAVEAQGFALFSQRIGDESERARHGVLAL